LLPDVTARSLSQDVTVAPGLSFPTFAHADLFAYLAVHGAYSGWSRLKWIADIAAMLSHETAQGIAELYDHSVRLGVDRCAAQALLLAERLFAYEIDPALRQRVATPINLWLMRTAFDAIVY